ncbi:MAG: helix-turn-helix domain-containing protein, partial [Gammaproteobacteria bacterium]|nr:helix-turn-helix domain-containing protein [Gammaproteobacteria bacterium]
MILNAIDFSSVLFCVKLSVQMKAFKYRIYPTKSQQE